MSTLLAEAMDHHRSGRLDEAERGYRCVLADQPDHADALHLLGVTVCQKGRRIEALGWIDRAIDRRPESAAYRGARGEVLRELGRLFEAAEELMRAIELNPSLPTAHNNLGLVHLREHRPDLALASFDEAIRLRPGFTTAHINRGEVLQALRRWNESARAYGKALELEPDNAWVHTYLGHVLAELGDVDRLDEAARHCRRALELAPGLGEAHTNLGNVYVLMHRLDDALAEYRRAVELNPLLSLAWSNIGRAEQQSGRFDAAAAAYERALALEPRGARFHANLAGLLADQDRHAEAVERFRVALGHEPDHAEAHHGMALSLMILGHRAEAVTALEAATRLQPERPEPRLAMCRVFAEDGDFDRSLAGLRGVLARSPGSAEAHFQLATILRDRLPDEDLRAMTERINHPYHAEVARAHLAFGIATVLDARGRHAEAVEFFAIGNAQQASIRARRCQAFDRERSARIVGEIIDSFTPEVFRRLRGRGHPSRRPIFIVGMPRSGTTLTEQVLAGHPRVFGAGELDDVTDLARRLAVPSNSPTDLVRNLLDRDDSSFRELADGYLAKLEGLDRSVDHVIDKMPSNYLHLGLIAALWPESRIIVCRRDPRDVAVSCWTTCFATIPWANDLGVIAEQIIEHDRLIAHWKAVLPIPLIEVAYEELVADFETQARRLVESVGLPWDPACLEFHSLKRTIRTASLGQVRKPIYSKSVGRWKNYASALTPMLETFVRHHHPLDGR